MSENIEKQLKEAVAVRQLPTYKPHFVDAPVKGTHDPKAKPHEAITYNCPSCGMGSYKANTGHYPGELKSTPIFCTNCGATFVLQTQT